MTMSTLRLSLWMYLLIILGGISGVAHAQGFPNKTLRFVTTGVGASTDFAARVIAQGLTDSVGWQIVVDNRGSTITASETVSKSSIEGYTLLVMTDGLWRGPLLQKMPFDPVKDFAPIALTSRSPNILVVHASVAAKTVKELIALAKAKPGELHYGAGAIGASTHLAAELFNLMAGVKIVHVPYKSSGLALNAVLGGQIQLIFATTGGVTPHVKAGRLRALGVSTAQPSAVVPGLATIAAAGGLPGYESASTAAVLAPTGTSGRVISLLNTEINRALNRAEVKERFFSQGVEVILGSTPEQTAAFIKADMATTARIVKETGMTGEQ